MNKFVNNFCLLILVFYFVAFVNAQLSSYNIARYVEVEDTKVEIGSIISQNADGSFIKSRKAYDTQVKGVVVANPAIYVKSDDGNERFAVVNTGYAKILANTSNGQIKRGELLRTSATPGVAVRSDKSGFVVGTSLQDYSNKSLKQNNPTI